MKTPVLVDPSNLFLRAGRPAVSAAIWRQPRRHPLGGCVSLGAALWLATAIAHAAAISGKVFFDLNGNGLRDGPHATPPTSTQTSPAGVVFDQPGQHLVSLRIRLGDCFSEPAQKLVSVGPPALALLRAEGGPVFSWVGAGFQLQETTSLIPPVHWTPVPLNPVTVGDWCQLQVPSPTGMRFYRLEQTP
jgi:hypothetical protein